MRKVELQCVRSDGTLIAPLPEAVLDHVTWELNGPGEIVYSMQQNDPRIQVPQENLNEIQVFVDRKLMHWGLHYKTQEQPHQATFTCPGLMQYYVHRFVTNASLEFATKVDPTNTATWLPVEQLSIGAGVINAKSAGLNIAVADYEPSGVSRLRIYDLFSHQNVLNDILAEFPTLANDVGDPTGFDFDIDISQAPKRLFRMYYPQRGIQQKIPFQWKRNIVNYTNNVDGAQLCNSVYFTGGSSGDVKYENHFKDLASQYVDFEDVRSQSSEADTGVLLELAQRWVVDHNVPPQTTDVDTIEVRDEPFLGTVNPGDWIHVTIKNGRTNVNSWKRIQKVTWKPNDQVIKFTLLEGVAS